MEELTIRVHNLETIVDELRNQLKRAQNDIVELAKNNQAYAILNKVVEDDIDKLNEGKNLQKIKASGIIIPPKSSKPTVSRPDPIRKFFVNKMVNNEFIKVQKKKKDGTTHSVNAKYLKVFRVKKITNMLSESGLESLNKLSGNDRSKKEAGMIWDIINKNKDELPICKGMHSIVSSDHEAYKNEFQLNQQIDEQNQL